MAKTKKKKKHLFTKNLLLAVGLVAVLLLVSSTLLRVVTNHNKELVVPDFTNMSVPMAEYVAGEIGIKVQVSDSVYVRRMTKGAVFRQNPKPGAKVKKGRRILLTINAVVPKSITMPNIVGLSMRQAKAELLSRGLTLGKLVYVNDLATNNVLKQQYRGRDIEPGSTIESGAVIDLVLGLNKSDNVTYVPYVIGSRYINAVDALHDNSLNVGKLRFDNTVKTYTDSLNAMVYRQTPEFSSEAYLMGTTVTLYLTTDVEKVPERVLPEFILVQSEEE